MLRSGTGFKPLWCPHTEPINLYMKVSMAWHHYCWRTHCGDILDVDDKLWQDESMVKHEPLALPVHTLGTPSPSPRLFPLLRPPSPLSSERHGRGESGARRGIQVTSQSDDRVRVWVLRPVDAVDQSKQRISLVFRSQKTNLIADEDKCHHR